MAARTKKKRAPFWCALWCEMMEKSIRGPEGRLAAFKECGKGLGCFAGAGLPAPDGFLFLDMAFEGLVARVREKSFHGLHGIRRQYCEPCDFGGDKIVERFVIGNAGDDAHVERFGSGDRLGGA